jgi:branched-chain amino acid transport system substrate-binding protein
MGFCLHSLTDFTSYFKIITVVFVVLQTELQKQKTKKEKRVKRLFALLLVLSFPLFGEGGQESDVIKIGTIQPTSGEVALYGVAANNAVVMAVEEINAAGGIDGKMVMLIEENNESTAEKTVNSFKKLVENDGVVAIVGALTSGNTGSITNLAQEFQIPLITPTATREDITDAGDFVFRACFIDPFQGRVVAQFAENTLGAQKAAILYNLDNPYSSGLYETFSAAFGGEILAESFKAGNVDFNAQILKIKDFGPDVIFVPEYTQNIGLITKQARDAGLEGTFLGADGWDGITGSAGNEILGSYYSNHFTPEGDDAEVIAFVSAYEAKYGETPSALAALAYDATKILLTAIDEANSTDATAIKNALAATSGKYVTGQISFDEKRNPVKSAVMIEVVAAADGLSTQYAGTVNP